MLFYTTVCVCVHKGLGERDQGETLESCSSTKRIDSGVPPHGLYKVKGTIIGCRIWLLHHIKMRDVLFCSRPSFASFLQTLLSFFHSLFCICISLCSTQHHPLIPVNRFKPPLVNMLLIIWVSNVPSYMLPSSSSQFLDCCLYNDVGRIHSRRPTPKKESQRWPHFLSPFTKLRQMKSSWSLASSFMSTSTTSSSSSEQPETESEHTPGTITTCTIVSTIDPEPPIYDDPCHPWSSSHIQSGIQSDEDDEEHLPPYECTVSRAGQVFVKREREDENTLSNKRSWR